ncbi:hypothetical protein V1498_10435 [Peribacillus sp. SCS-26]|uniref:hypothetical protein n=1 Tax=Paraperibacillus marinus TaxID=3115295 RepID=UPI0039063F01
MSLEWFDRVAGELQDHLESICQKYDQMGYMTLERGSKHPRIEFYVESDDTDSPDGREYFFTLNYDPNNEEFYMDSFEPEMLSAAKIILSDIEDIVDAVHEGFHEYMNGDEYSMDEEADFDTDEDEFEVQYQYADDEEYAGGDDELYASEGDALLEQVNVEWETPEVTAFMQEDEVEVTYQFGIVPETGDGVLRRINRIWTEDDDLIKDETNFIFSKEEASTIIAMIASNMDSMTEMDYH